ncbi:MAG: flagellar hook-length control protein FliK [Steroidobacteraceae bacterium]
MNAAPIIQVSVAANVSPSGSPGTTSAASPAVGAAVGSANATPAGPSFAGALMAVGAKSSRKSATPKTVDDGQPGASLPLTGIQPPPVAPVMQAALSAASALQMPAATNTAAGVSAGGADAEDRAIGVLASTAKQIASGTGLPSAGTTRGAAIDSSDASTELDGAKAIAAAGAPPLAGASNNLLGLPSGGAATTATAGRAVPSSASATAAAAAEEIIAKTPGEGALSKGAAQDTARDTVGKSGAAALSKGAVQDTARDTVVRSGSAADDDSPPSGVSANTAAPASDASAAIVAAAGGMAASTKATAPAAAPAKPASVGATSDGDSDDSGATAGSSAPSASAAGISPSGTAIALPHQAAGLTSAQSAAALSVAANPDKPVHAAADAATLGSTNGDAAAGLSLLSSNSAVGGSVAASATPTLQIHASVDSADFSQGLSDRVSWMANNGVNSAKLQVNPPQLGPIELNILVQGDHAQVSMITHSAVTRDALESSSPQLREMLGAQGFGQVSVDISQRSFQDRSAYTPPYERASSGDRSAAATPAVAATTASTPRSSLGALDAYA